MNPLYKKWVNLSIIINNNLPFIPNLKCPKCDEEAIDFIHIGNSETKVGFMDVWCNSCLYGIHLSRVLLPEKAEIIPFEIPAEKLLKKVPNFKQVTP